MINPRKLTMTCAWRERIRPGACFRGKGACANLDVSLQQALTNNNENSHMCYHYLQTPLLQKPPREPLPDPTTAAQWYGELYLQYPLNPIRFPVHHAQLFKAKADLRIIMNDVGLYYFRRDGGRRKPSKEIVERFHARLVAWFDSLPESLLPVAIVLPPQLLLQ
jgi:hypothetical protein